MNPAKNIIVIIAYCSDGLGNNACRIWLSWIIYVFRYM